MDDPEDWLLTADERGNPATDLPGLDVGQPGRAAGPRRRPTSTGWSTRCEALNAGDHLFFTDWRGDPDERLREDGPTVAELFTEALHRGVCVRGLVWRSHMGQAVASARRRTGRSTRRSSTPVAR